MVGQSEMETVFYPGEAGAPAGLAEEWRRAGQLHREDGPAVTVRRADKVVFEAWLKDGILDRPDGPARIERDVRTDVVTSEQWWRAGKLHRDGGGPALTERYGLSGRIIREQWWQDGKLIAPLWARGQPVPRPPGP